MNHPIVVGVDGSAPGLDAVELAAREAARRERPLRVVYAFIWPYIGLPISPSPVSPLTEGLMEDAERIVREAGDRARQVAPSVAVTGEAITGAPVPILIDESESASIIVVGDRGLGGFTGLLVGSVAVQLAAHSSCPLMVARGRKDLTGDVLLGVDGSPENDPAIGFAFEEASLRGAALTAVHAWTHPVRAEPGDVMPAVYDVTETESAEARILAEALAGWRDKYPDVAVRRRLVHGRVRPMLIEATSEAQLVVVGTRGRGGFTGLLLGSVSHALLHHADCPVAIVPAARARRGRQASDATPSSDDRRP
jgi:nucleotide-binding universal stress UspA family protein